MRTYLSTEERCLLALLKQALSQDKQKKNIKHLQSSMDTVRWEQVLALGKKHVVCSLLYEALKKEKGIAPWLRQELERTARQTVQQSYRLLFLNKGLTDYLESMDIPTLVLKGSAVGEYYPIPELRKSGDVDLLLLEPEKLAKACEALEQIGYVRSQQQHALHHVSMQSPENIEVELHCMLAEPFDSDKMNQYMKVFVEECKNHWCRKKVMGVELPVLEDGYFAFSLLIHMLQHFLRAGFGIKLLCDWVVFWNSPHSAGAKEAYLRMLRDTGLKGFSDMVTAVCVYELGLREEVVSFMFDRKKPMPSKEEGEVFLREILDAEEFGKSGKDRMVMLRGTSWRDYLREFHHQMQLNFPTSGRCALCWPVTWGITLARFLRNNRKLRGVSTKAILHRAGVRSKVMERIGLFETK